MRISLGVACFHFYLGESLSIREYFNKLEIVLNSVSGISGVKTQYEESEVFSSIHGTNETQTRSLNSGTGISPSLCDARIEFNLHIPEEKQRNFSFPHICEIEDFNITLIYNHLFTFTLIESLNSDIEKSGSGAVPLVRDFLQSELEKTVDPAILECLGPSPMHIDFDIIQTNRQLIEKECEFIYPNIGIQILKDKAYDQFLFHGTPEIFTSKEQAKEIFIQVLEDELSLYYLIVLSKTYQLHLWETIDSQLTDLQIRFSRRNLKKHFSGQLLSQLVLCLFQLKQYKISAREEVNGLKQSILTDRRELFLREYINKEIEDNDLEPIRDITDLINFLDNKYNNYQNNFYLLFSVVIGGIIGFLASYFLNLLIH